MFVCIIAFVYTETERKLAEKEAKRQEMQQLLAEVSSSSSSSSQARNGAPINKSKAHKKLIAMMALNPQFADDGGANVVLCFRRRRQLQ